jgi:hypothetical protein
MGSTCNTRGEMINYNILAGKPDGRVHSETVVIHGRTILNGSHKIGLEFVDWICLARDRDQ